jgi:hypothetical protein
MSVVLSYSHSLGCSVFRDEPIRVIASMMYAVPSHTEFGIRALHSDNDEPVRSLGGPILSHAQTRQGHRRSHILENIEYHDNEKGAGRINLLHFSSNCIAVSTSLSIIATNREK